MTTLKNKRRIYLPVFVLLFFSLSGCLTAKKLDRFVATQYNNELPKLSKRKKADINITSIDTARTPFISTTVHKTDQFLPLLVYWKYNHRQHCSLNPTIAVVHFSNAVNAVATKGLTDKLAGRKLELTVEQAPAAFSIVSKENMIWVVYAISWAKVYIEPDPKDLVVSYKLLESDQTVKTGTITVKNTDTNKGIRYFQSWKSATSDYLSAYNAHFTTLAKSLVTQLSQEL